MTNEEQYAFRDWCWKCKPELLVATYDFLKLNIPKPTAGNKHKARIAKAIMTARGIK